MANRKATFAKRQRETDLKDRAKQKEDRRTQKRGEVRESKGPQIAWDEAVHATTSAELPPLGTANQGARGRSDGNAVAEIDAVADAGAQTEVASEAPTPSLSSTTPVAPTPSPTPTKPALASAKPGTAATKPATAPNPASPRPAG